MGKDKIETLLGFCIKSGNVLWGADHLFKGKRHNHLVILCAQTAVGTKNRVVKEAEQHGTPVLITMKPLAEITHRMNCKVISILDRQMSLAILASTNENYKLLGVEENRIDGKE